MEGALSQHQVREISEEVFESTFKTRKLAEKAVESVKKANELQVRYASIEGELVSRLTTRPRRLPLTVCPLAWCRRKIRRYRSGL